MTLKSRLMPACPVAVAHLSSLSSSSVRSAIEPFNSVITAPGARGLVARIQSSDFPVACAYREVWAISMEPFGR